MKRLIFLLFLLLVMPVSVLATGADMSINSSDIEFSTDTFVAGDSIRIYTRVRNEGDVDIIGYVTFYNADSIIGTSQIVSLTSDGAYEDIWVDFIVPHDDQFNIRAVIEGSDPEDTNSSNDISLTPIYSIQADDDYDGVVDSEDNCVGIDNPDQDDADGDGLGDECDDDDDDDGYIDSEDEFPNDPERHEIIMIAEVVETPAVVEVVEAIIEPEVALYTSTQSDTEPVPELYTDLDLESVEPELVDDIVEVEGVDENGEKLVSTSFTYEKKGWKTYEFKAYASESNFESLSWDFGDGSSSAQSTITHEFSGPGTYFVQLNIEGYEGKNYMTSTNITVSFFHLQNPLVLIIIGALVLLGALSTSVIAKKPKQRVKKVEAVSAPTIKRVAPKKKVVKKKTVTRKRVVKKKIQKKKQHD